MKNLVKIKDKAAKAMIRGDWAGALKQLLLAKEAAPRDTYVALKIGDMHQRLGAKPDAVAAYKTAAALFAKAGFLVKAISINKIILSIDPGERAVQKVLAKLYDAQRSEMGMSDSAPEAPVLELTEEISLDVDLARLDPNKLPRTPLLSDLTGPEVDALIDELVPVVAAAGTIICREGEPAESMFLIVEGLVKISSRDKEGKPLWLTNLVEGDFFGEFGLLGDGIRHADVEAVEDTELLRFGREQLARVVERHPRVQEVLFFFYKQRVVDTLLAKNFLFRGLTPEQRKGLLSMAALEIHDDGSRIIQEGDDGEHLFIIKSGLVRVFTGMSGKRIDLASLHPGDLFGEISVLTGAPTTANVESVGRVELVKFSRREVLQIAEEYPRLSHVLGEMKEHRIHDTIRRIQTEGFV
ncbi:MAG: cyclic nucleotide-binding domain-containing protein [Deltaproteobacteria bacterium]|nr:cyclic nucleotide-binding domain-containing protein [Deltaproteobacteria bacterium]